MQLSQMDSLHSRFGDLCTDVEIECEDRIKQSELTELLGRSQKESSSSSSPVPQHPIL